MTERGRPREPVDRLPPHSQEAEQGVLGCCLQAPRESLALCLERLPSGEAAFYDERHRRIYRALVELFDAQVGMDLVTVSQRLRDWGILEEVGGLAYLSELQDAVPSAANLGYYLEIVREKHTNRSLVAACTEVIARANEPLVGHEIEALVDEAERRVLSIRGERVAAAGDLDARALMQQAVEALQARLAGEDRPVATGFPRLDDFLGGGLRPGQMIVLAARPSTGKSALGLQMAAHVARDLPVGVFSLEMTAQEIALREIGRESGVDLRRYRPGAEIDDPSIRAITFAAARYKTSKLLVNDTASLTVSRLRAIARRWKRDRGLSLLVVDYLQLLNADRTGRDRREVVEEISRGVKLLAKELAIPVIVLSQLNREMEKEKNRKPRLSDLRESGAIEQDADVVLMLYQRPPKDEEEPRPDEPVRISLLLAKQRNGPRNVDVHFRFHGALFRFTEEERMRPSPE